MDVKEGVELGEPYLTCGLARYVLVCRLVDRRMDASAQVSGGKVRYVSFSGQKTKLASDGNGTTPVFEEAHGQMFKEL